MSKQSHRTCVRMSAKDYDLLKKKSAAADLSANAWLMAQLAANRPVLYREAETWDGEGPFPRCDCADAGAVLRDGRGIGEYGAGGNSAFPSRSLKIFLSDGGVMTINQYAQYIQEQGWDDRFRYMLLDRMRSDCDYFLGNGQIYGNHLWAENVTDQIGYMKALWNSFPEDGKPEWLTMEQILNYAKQMLALLAAKSRDKGQTLK